MKNIVYYLGNRLVSIDSKPSKIIPVLKKKFPKIDFMYYDPTEELSDDTDNFILIDTVAGISKVQCFDDLNYFTKSPRTTVHDFDLPISLGLLQKLGKLKKVTIIGVPAKGPKRKIIEEIVKILESL